MAEFSGTPAGAGRRAAVVASRFNESVTQPLADGALDALVRHGVAFDDVDVVWVPGAWELPSASRRLLESGRYDLLVVVGAVVRGETPHFDYVAGNSASGLAHIAAETGVPIGFGVLTTNTVEQAVDRAGAKGGNKGFDAVMTAIEMANLLKAIRGGSQ